MKLLNSQLAKIAIEIPADTNPTVAFDYTIRQLYPDLTQSQRSRLYRQMLDSRLVHQVWEDGYKGSYTSDRVCRWELSDGITKEML